jgi:hypothetical protein
VDQAEYTAVIIIQRHVVLVVKAEIPVLSIGELAALELVIMVEKVVHQIIHQHHQPLMVLVINIHLVLGVL